MQGYSLMELLIVVVILGIIATIGIPQYNGYVDSTNVVNVQNNLRAIYLQQQDYFLNNNGFYSTGATCNDSAAAINTNLFSGTQVVDNTLGYDFCILQATANDFEARAEEVAGARVFTINQLNVNNF